MKQARPPSCLPDCRWRRRRLGQLVYADWLIRLSELPALLGVRPVRSELVYLLVSLDKEYAAGQPGEPWETYAQRILRHFSPPSLKRAGRGLT